jgi:hypothetical protein
MGISFYSDPETGLPHVYEHGITEEEVRQILAGSGPEAPARRNSRMKLGQTQAGRYLQVIFVRRKEPDDLFVITAYELRGKAKRAYRRRRRRRGR